MPMMFLTTVAFISCEWQEVKMAPPSKNYNVIISSNLPEWLKDIRLDKVMHLAVGEAYDSKLNMLIHEMSIEDEIYSILVTVQLKDLSPQTVSFILKLCPSNEMLDLFKEEEVYYKILPRFEQMYSDIGKNIQFSARAYKFDTNVNYDYVLLENLYAKAYKRVSGIKGLDMMHMQEVLKKLAEYHAVSAFYIESYGSFGDAFNVGAINCHEILCENSMEFLKHLKHWKNCSKYHEKLAENNKYFIQHLLDDQKFNTAEFNVLNNGNLSVNTIIFQYDAFDKIKNCRFVDFAWSKYGSPSHDLYQLILSSCAADIKLQKFDYFIRYYYEHLTDKLKLLEYPRPLPKLSSIHCSLLKNGLAAYLTISKVLPAVIWENSEQLNSKKYLKPQLTNAMFTNSKYVKEMLEILPWLDNRGLLDWK